MINKWKKKKEAEEKATINQQKTKTVCNIGKKGALEQHADAPFNVAINDSEYSPIVGGPILQQRFG